MASKGPGLAARRESAGSPKQKEGSIRPVNNATRMKKVGSGVSAGEQEAKILKDKVKKSSRRLSLDVEGEEAEQHAAVLVFAHQRKNTRPSLSPMGSRSFDGIGHNSSRANNESGGATSGGTMKSTRKTRQEVRSKAIQGALQGEPTSTRRVRQAVDYAAGVTNIGTSRVDQVLFQTPPTGKQESSQSAFLITVAHQPHQTERHNLPTNLPDSTKKVVSNEPTGGFLYKFAGAVLATVTGPPAITSSASTHHALSNNDAVKESDTDRSSHSSAVTPSASSEAMSSQYHNRVEQNIEKRAVETAMNNSSCDRVLDSSQTDSDKEISTCNVMEDSMPSQTQHPTISEMEPSLLPLWDPCSNSEDNSHNSSSISQRGCNLMTFEMPTSVLDFYHLLQSEFNKPLCGGSRNE